MCWLQAHYSKNLRHPVSAGFQKTLVKTKRYPNHENQTCKEPCTTINNLGYTAIGPKFTVLETNAAEKKKKKKGGGEASWSPKKLPRFPSAALSAARREAMGGEE